jgi:glutathione peroxidase
MPDLLDLPVTTLDGTATTFGSLTDGRVSLVVNVASRCGLTPQYAKLEALQEELGGSDFTVLGFPCNQFGGQEPGTAEEISTFCSTTYGVTFPLTDKIEVNGPDRDAVYDVLAETLDAEGGSGDIQWNFEKFVVGADGRVLGRFRPRTEPDAPEIRDCIQRGLNAD